MARLACSLPAARQRLGRLAPQRQKRSRYSYAELRPDRDSNAGPTAQELTSWSALTSTCAQVTDRSERL